jgi:hypothetical protein
MNAYIDANRERWNRLNEVSCRRMWEEIDFPRVTEPSYPNTQGACDGSCTCK